MKGMARLLIGLVLAFAILWILAREADLPAVLEILRGADPGLLALAVAVQLPSLYGKGLRWSLAIAAATGRRPDRRLFSAMVIGTAGNILFPARLGDFARVIVLRRHNDIPASLSLVASWSVQLFDFLLVASILLAAAGPGLASPAALAGTIAAALALLAFLAAINRWPRAAERIEARLPGALRRRFGPLLVTARGGLGFLGRPRVVVAVVGSTLAIWAIDATGMTLALRAFDLPGGYGTAALLVAGIGLSFVLPLTPGSLGTLQLVCVLVLATVGVERDRSLAFGLGLQALTHGAIVLLGLALMQREGLAFRRLRRDAEAAPDGDPGARG
jgi:uncharacterized protein (TIRG00374 family)